jgi:hypothetical protein
MYSEDELESAVHAGALSAEAAAAFRSHVAALRTTHLVDEEQFRLITSFNDVFVVIACALLLAAIAWIFGSAEKSLGGVGAAIAAWGLAEFFTRKRRMALPSIFLVFAFVGGVFATVFFLRQPTPTTAALASALAGVSAWLHWLRFRVPVTVAAGVATLVAIAFILLFEAVPEAKSWVNAMSFVAGLVVFYLAMRWDAADPGRRTRKADVAFWLHLLAAPLVVRPMFEVLGVFDGEANVMQGVAVIVLYAAIGLVSLAVDRRALMVSALLYVLYAFSALLQKFGVVSLSFAITALVIGSALLLLSAFWHASRLLLLQVLPPWLRRKLPSLQ